MLIFINCLVICSLRHLSLGGFPCRSEVDLWSASKKVMQTADSDMTRFGSILSSCEGLGIEFRTALQERGVAVILRDLGRCSYF